MELFPRLTTSQVHDLKCFGHMGDNRQSSEPEPDLEEEIRRRCSCCVVYNSCKLLVYLCRSLRGKRRQFSAGLRDGLISIRRIRNLSPPLLLRFPVLPAKVRKLQRTLCSLVSCCLSVWQVQFISAYHLQKQCRFIV